MSLGLSDCHSLHISIHQGTWAFQSLRIAQEPENDLVEVPHNRLDNLESFYHLLFWVSLQHAPHKLTPERFDKMLTSLFDDAAFIGAQPYSVSYRRAHMVSTASLDQAEFQNPPLRRLLLRISASFVPLYDPPTRSSIEDRYPTSSAEEVNQEYEAALRTYEANIILIGWKCCSQTNYNARPMTGGLLHTS